jgi:DNA-directed RNA polymerase subunit K/omega
MPPKKLNNGKIIIKNSKKQKKQKKQTYQDSDFDEGSFSDDLIADTDFESVDGKVNDDVVDPGNGLNQEDDLNIEDKDDIDENDEEEYKIEEDDDQEDEEDKLDDNGGYGDEENEIIDDEINRNESCLYKFSNKNLDDDDEIEDELHFEDDNEIKNTDIITDPQLREAKPILTKYERVRILGDRAKQLSLGAKSMLLNVDNLQPKEIAKLELQMGKIPFKIEKVFPDGRREIWKVSELTIIN